MNECIIYVRNRKTSKWPDDVLKFIYDNVYRGSEDKTIKRYTQYSTKLTLT